MMYISKNRYRVIKSRKDGQLYENLLMDDEYITLQDILENFKGSYLKVGFKNGSGYIWCDKINKYSFDTINGIAISKYEELKGQCTDDNFINQKDKMKNKLDNYKLYTELQVLDFYRSDNPLEDDDVYNNCYIALLEGDVKGQYWTVKEYQKRWDKCI